MARMSWLKKGGKRIELVERVRLSIGMIKVDPKIDDGKWYELKKGHHDSQAIEEETCLVGKWFYRKGDYVLRAHVHHSMKNLLPLNVTVIISSTSGNLKNCTCSCKASASGR